MKRFDSDAAYLRIKERLEMMSEWAQIAPNGTISNILKVFAEEENELARYLEFLYQEKKFKNARTLSAVTSMTDLISYKQQLPKSAIGYVIVSHTDKNGVNRLANYGVDFFDLDAASDYDDLSQKQNATSEERAALVPWTANTSYSVPAGTVFKSSDGTQYIATESVESRSLKEPFSSIRKDAVKYADFVSAGGWNGIKYLKVPVIQGIQRSKQLGQAQGTRFESFTLDDLSVENGSNIISCNYFNVSVEPYRKNSLNEDESLGEVQTWEKIENIRLAGPYDKVFEVKVLVDEGKLLVKFGDGITGRMLPKDAIVTVNYLQTKGASGNATSKYQITSIELPDMDSMVDPRTNQLGNFLNCTNIAAVMGGKDIEDEDDLKANAPVSYLKSYTVSSKKSYLKQIEEFSPVNLLHLQIFNSEVVDAESYGNAEDAETDEYTSSIDTSHNVLQEVVTTKNAMIISALRGNGQQIDDPENELLVPIRESLDDYMSPNDSLEFMQPNLVKVCPRITVLTTSTMLENDIASDLRPKVYSKFSVFNMTYGDTLYASKLIDLVHNQSYCDAVDCFFEAKATVDMEPTILTNAAANGNKWLDSIGVSSNDMTSFDNTVEAAESLFAFDFKFDKIFAQDAFDRGFRNYKDNAPYLLKVNIVFNDSPEDSRTLFLLDRRKSLKDEITVEQAYKTKVDESKNAPSFELATYGVSASEEWPDVFDENFQNLQARTAQFSLISSITSSSFMDQALGFVNSPFEIRPLYVDEAGKNAVFNKDDVPETDQVSFSLDGNVATETCYRRNWQYWNHCKIEFSEKYESSSSDDYASGRIILPVKKVLNAQEIASLKTLFETSYNSFEEQTPEIKKMLKDKMKIEVFAMPLQNAFKCEQAFDIVSIDKDDIQIEKKYLTRK